MNKLLIITILVFCYIESLGQDKTRTVDLGGNNSLEFVLIPSGSFMMGSTHEAKVWATGRVGGGIDPNGPPGTGERENYEGPPRLTHVKDSFWMTRTEITV